LACLAKNLPIPAIVGYAAHANESTGKAAANAAALIENGRIAFVQHKMLLPTYDVFDESGIFSRARAKTFLFQTQLLGITICEDIWNDKNFWSKQLYDRSRRGIGRKGAAFLINISGSPYTIDKVRYALTCCAPWLRHMAPVIYVNQVGGNDSLVFDGGSLVIMPDGRIAAQARSFDEDLVYLTPRRHRRCAPATGKRTRCRAPGPDLRYARLRLQIWLSESSHWPQRRH